MKRLIGALGAVVLTLSLGFAASEPASAAIQPTYYDTILSDAPDAYYRLNEPASSNTARDSSGNGRDAPILGGPNTSVVGPLLADSDAALGNNGGAINIADPQSVVNPTTFTQEAWFRSTSTSGGRLMGFGSSASGSSTNYDRVVYLNGSGTISFGTYTSQNNYATSTRSYNDGAWHLVDATLDGSGMKLYVDGVLVGSNSTTGGQNYTGYWRLGWDKMDYWGTWARNLPGEFDEYAVWNSTALSATTILNHYKAFATNKNVLSVGIAVDPTFSFTVASHSGACNSFSQTAGVTTGSTGVALGRVNSAAGSIAAQDLSIGTNANSGFSLQLRTSGPLTSGSNTIANAPGTNASPAAFPATSSAAFGYTVSGLSRFSSAWAGPETTNREVMSATTVGTVTNCIAYRVQVTASTPASTYSTTAYYTAVPTF